MKTLELQIREEKEKKKQEQIERIKKRRQQREENAFKSSTYQEVKQLSPPHALSLSSPLFFYSLSISNIKSNNSSLLLSFLHQ
jgi:hypothetical protein